jgi:diacylglycerol kinase (ATP)
VTRQIAVLTNPTSGKGRAAGLDDLVVPRLQNSGASVRRLQGRNAEEAKDLADQCVADGIDTLVVVGGDGMVHLAIQSLAGTETALGVVPAGTGNDVSRYFEIPRDDPVAAVDAIIAGKTRTIDLGKVGPTYFISVLAGGLDAIVNERVNRMSWPKGQMRYNIATIAALRSFKPISYRIDIDGEELAFEATTLAVGNTSSYGGGMRIAEGADAEDGLLDLVVIGPGTPRELLTTFPLVFKGAHVHHPKFHRWQGKRITIAAAGITAYADGEPIAPLPLTVEVAPSAMRIITP